MTKILTMACTSREIVRRVAHAKSSDPATPLPKKKLKRAPGAHRPKTMQFARSVYIYITKLYFREKLNLSLSIVRNTWTS